jgi:hypothetical protein
MVIPVMRPSSYLCRSGSSSRRAPGDLIRALELMIEWSRHPTARAVQAILAERHRHPELVDALYSRVVEPAGRRFTATVLHRYAQVGQLDPGLITPVVGDIGEALVMKHALDTGEGPTPQRRAEIVDQAILPAVRGYPGGR